MRPFGRKLLSLFSRVPYFGRPVSWQEVRPFAGGRRLEASIISVVLTMALVHGTERLNRYGLEPLKSLLGRLREAAASGLELLREWGANHPDAASFFRSQAAEERLEHLQSALARAAAALPERIPIPEDSVWILGGFFLLLLGTALYRLFAPDSVKEYTETRWVAELRRPRLLYIRDKFGCGPYWWFYLPVQCLSYVASVAGLLVLSYVFLKNFWQALMLALRLTL